ncbi:class I SAM-dependent methyltransferase [Steroidobacter sp. S1-65]|uniref:Class I SAM-dependent methyltransferase n=1 Tax=Steroidobacter gossypii TaxID=2805490 RepID=A0ABS1WYA1_9GAMM|nr:class I SAM-dependent methyltransferase [Steroidobacter gossypii]MBM0105955.1 class I SAM-dependent methyltransferase [Steroidobacter gossypii]
MAVDSTAWKAFTGIAEHYDCRPPYPRESVEAINRRMSPRLQGAVIEVGAGTGIFTRLLARELRPAGPILAIEPSSDMRATAARSTPDAAKVSYIDGAAEQLPVEDGAARLVVAAAAAQRFDRPRFYAEARRVLAPGGVLALVQNSLDDSRSAFVDEYFSMLEKHAPTYRRGMRTARDGSYQDIDYATELREASQLTDVEALRWPIDARVDRQNLIQLVRTSTILQSAIERLGIDAVLAEALSIFARHADTQGVVTMTYVNETFIAGQPAD